MKKQVLIGTLALASLAASAQTPFFSSVPYRGAFAPEPAAPWTAGWTNFDPQNTDYGAPTVTVNGGDITTNTTWTANNVYLLNDGYVYVTNNATLTIEPGTVIRGAGKGTLIICRGAKIMAEGTETDPIVFTSSQAVGDRDFGDWGGLVICGSAQHNISTGADAPAEGGIAKPLPSPDGRHGGTNDDDNSGVLTYVRIEFPGIPLASTANSEINGLSMYSVGRNTKIDHVQVSYSGDDAYEWFGGTVDAKHLVAFKSWDDDFDTDNGYRGRVQFGVAFRDSRFADQSTSNGFESDNDANGSQNTPVTAPVFSNITMIGPKWNGNPDTTNSLFGRTVHHRRNSRISIFNSLLGGWPTGYYADKRLVSANLCTDLSDPENNIIAGSTTNFDLASSSDTLCITDAASLGAWFAAAPQSAVTLTQTNDLSLVNPFGNSNTNPDFRPTASSPAATGALFTNGKLLPISTASINETVTEAGVSVYPNPAAETVTVSLGKGWNGEVSVQVLDLNGKVVLAQNNITVSESNNSITADVTSLVSGVYLVRVSNTNAQHVAKLVVR